MNGTQWRLLTANQLSLTCHASDADTLDNILTQSSAVKHCLRTKGYTYDQDDAVWKNSITGQWITLSIVMDGASSEDYDLWSNDYYPIMEQTAPRAELNDAQVIELTTQLEFFANIVDDANSRGDLSACCIYASFVLAIAALLG